MKRMNATDRVAAGAAILLALVAALSLMMMCGGCLYKGGKITEGVDLAVGLTIPGSEETMQLNLVNYLSGFRLGVAEDAALTLRYTCASSNSWLGCVHTTTYKTIDATVSPCETSPTNGVTSAEACE